MIFLELFLIFLKIGAFTFGGGYAMLPLMKQEVLLRGWMSEEQLLNFIAVAESTPGPVAVNMATYIGVERAGVFGAFCATLGVVLPSFVIILLVAKFYTKYKNSFIVRNCLTGLRPVVIGLIAAAIIELGYGVFFPNGIDLAAFDFGFFSSLIIFVLVVILAFKKVNPIYLILGSAGLGIISGYAEKLLL
ncbi:MAG: chromate transporter [Clostridia bacterium]|nr:chromate transporter [Clostridia bacterium]